MPNTRIILNRQSDLKLTNAEILSPTGLVKADIDGLDASLANLQNQIDTEVNSRSLTDTNINNQITGETSSRISADASLDAKFLLRFLLKLLQELLLMGQLTQH